MKKIIILILATIAVIVLVSGCVIQKDIVEPIEDECSSDVDCEEGFRCEKQFVCTKAPCDSPLVCKKILEPDELSEKHKCQQQGKLWFYGGFEQAGYSCIEKSSEIIQCENAGGSWKMFRNGCVDSCSKKPRFCTEALKAGCDCGATKCYGKGEGGCKTDTQTGVTLCTEPSLFPSCIDDLYEPYVTQQEACEATDGIWLIPEQIPFPIENKITCEENDGKWVDINKIINHNIDLGITTIKECSKYRGRCGGERIISSTTIGKCNSGTEDCWIADFEENECLLSLEKEQEIKRGNTARCNCPEGEIFYLDGCSIPRIDLMSIIAY